MILAIDPGREKCGLAVAGRDAVIARRIVLTPQLPDTVREWKGRYGFEKAVLGDRTGAEAVRRLLEQVPGLVVILVGEQGTTLLARRRYFLDHPPRGWRRLVPLSMQEPPEPYDDYAAVVIAERYLSAQTRSTRSSNSL